MDEQEVIKQLSEKYELIKQLINSYNEIAKSNKIDTRVGCIINENDDDDSYFPFDTEGWVPSNLHC